MISKETSSVLFFLIALLLVVSGLLLDPIPQPESYHHFADQNSWWGIPNTLNVISNLAFFIAGAWGLFLLLQNDKITFIDHRERWIWIVLSIGLILTAAGSGYYHLAPDNFRLVLDRLPMTIVFMSLIAALISERISIKIGLTLWPILIFIGFFSVWLWYKSELLGMSDLRFYIGIQLFTILITLIMLLTESHYTKSHDLILVIILFGLARLFELYDHQIYLLTKKAISGHTLKHLIAALAGVLLIRMIWKREIV